MNKSTMRYVSICGLLGYGYPKENLERAASLDIDFIGADAGSVDPGPYYLGSGNNFMKDSRVYRDLELALIFSRRQHIPLIIGTAGGAGAKPHLEKTVEIVKVITQKHNLHFRLAVISADIEPALLETALHESRISSLGQENTLTAEMIHNCSHIVGQMGTQPIVTALENGADVIIAGRCCDTAIFAAMPIFHGFDAGLAFHGAKLAECGTICARPPAANDSLLITLAEDHFIAEPLNPLRRCMPESVAAHSLYEQPNPEKFIEPEGEVTMAETVFEQYAERGVKVSGTKLIPAAELTIKIEGALLKGYRALTIAGIIDPTAIAHLDEIEAGVRQACIDNMQGAISPEDYSLIFRRYGMDAVSMIHHQRLSSPPSEVGLIIEAVASSQERADSIISLARATALHQSYEGRKTTAGNLAFPFSPSDLQGGPVYEFAIYHLLHGEEESSLFPITYEEL